LHDFNETEAMLNIKIIISKIEGGKENESRDARLQVSLVPGTSFG
jgi:hypothetical protein